VDASGNLVANPLRIVGTGLLAPGRPPAVTVGGQAVTVLPTPAPTATGLTVALSGGLDAGPQADVRVSAFGLAGPALPFVVSPWLAEVQPVRTALDSDPTRAPGDLKLTLRGSGFTAAPQAVRFDGPGGTTLATAFDPGGTDTQARVAVPAGLANGVYQVRLVRPDSAATNPRTVTVVPRIDPPVAVAVVNVNGVDVHQLTLNGARLNGRDVRVAVDESSYAVGANAQAGTLTVTLGRKLAPGSHPVAVTVDGVTSRTVSQGV
jgi:hypothetical protein